jgi:formylmethanofuran dehydrogenase subunit B
MACTCQGQNWEDGHVFASRGFAGCSGHKPAEIKLKDQKSTTEWQEKAVLCSSQIGSIPMVCYEKLFSVGVVDIKRGKGGGS